MNSCAYFTEVKYRSSSEWGDGFSYITVKKLKQMKFSAEMWLHNKNWQGEAVLQGASVDSQGNIEITELD
jgi:Holliday junction resolvase-like predicted endonuclease